MTNNNLNIPKSNIQIEFKAIKKFKKNKAGDLKSDVWKPEPEWIPKYNKIKYKGNPLDKEVQRNVHKIYNSLTPILQDEWLENTKGLGWSDNYIKIALTYWNKQGKHINRDKQTVDEYITTLSDTERDNFKDICEVFCPESPYIHIKSSFGFIEYMDNKQKILEYIDTLDVDEKDELDDITDDMSWAEKYNYILKSEEFNTYLDSLNKN